MNRHSSMRMKMGRLVERRPNPQSPSRSGKGENVVFRPSRPALSAKRGEGRKPASPFSRLCGRGDGGEGDFRRSTVRNLQVPDCARNDTE